MFGINRIQIVFIFLLVVFCLLFFSAKIAAGGIIKNMSYAYMLSAVLLSMPYFFRKSDGFVLPVQMICISILFSIIMSYFSWGQSFNYSISVLPCLILLVFFYLLEKKIPLIIIEYIVLFYGFLYILLFFYQFTHSDTVYFGFRDEFEEDRGIIRILFPGAGVFYLGYFIALNRVSEKNWLRWFLLTFLILGIIVTVLQVTRQSIAFILIITVFHFIRKASLFKKIAITVVFGASLIFAINSDNPISRGLVETQKETVSAGDKYIRISSGNYYLNDFSPNLLSRIFGNGMPNNTSAYGKFTSSLEINYGYYLTDVGFIGVYALFGVFAVLGYLIIIVKSLLMTLPERFVYLKYYILLLGITCLTTDALYSIHFMITNVFVFYGFQYLYEENKLKSFIINKYKTIVNPR